MNQHEHLYVARTRHVMSKSNSLEEIPYDINQASLIGFRSARFLCFEHGHLNILSS
ncbi:hypothetical protein MA16_Dca017210 [Dendrobium catenatum]|uniref:Uncharacterized protein n=1 Tax=Dendrobium catenatum TaxID=906689 RepID=A0A2I0W2Q1_9ASPA|nr:hypothetical protein MA16_Dca017210 [Dendrobium catenatum]